MGVEFDFRINVTDCLAGFSLLNGLSLFVGCVVVPFLPLFFFCLFFPSPLMPLLCVSGFWLTVGQSCLGLWMLMGQKNNRQLGLISVDFLSSSLPTKPAAAARRRVVAIVMRRPLIQSSLTGNNIKARRLQCPKPHHLHLYTFNIPFNFSACIHRSKYELCD